MAESGKDGKYWYRFMTNPSSNLRKLLKSGEPQLHTYITTLKTLGASLDVISERVKNDDKAQEYRDMGNGLFSSSNDTAKVAEMYTQSIAYALPGSRALALGYANRSAVSFKATDYEGCLLDIERSLENDYPENMKAKLYARRVRCLVALERPQTEIDKALEDTRKALLRMDSKATGRDLVERVLTDKNHMAPTVSKGFDFSRFSHAVGEMRMGEIPKIWMVSDLRKSFNPRASNWLKPTVPQDDSCEIRGATGVSIQYSEKYGRHLIATKDILPGEIFAVIDVYANARSSDKCYRQCAQCTKPMTVGIPCGQCVNVIYCSTSCRNKAWNDYHRIECPILGILLDLEIPTNTLLGMKITLKALREAGGVVELKEMLEEIDSVPDPRMKGFTENVFDCTKYASIYTLTSHAEKHTTSDSHYISLTSIFAIYYMATQTETFGRKYNASLDIFDENPLLIFLGELMIKNCDIVQMIALRNRGAGAVKDDVQIAPLTALCNHSCNPNVAAFGNNKSVVFAIQPIKAGEQIWDNYLSLHFSRVPKAQRQQMLKREYHFICDCEACTKNWPMLEELPKATEMPGMSPAKRSLLRRAQKEFSITHDVVVMLLILHEHAWPCQEMMTYQDYLMKKLGGGLDLF